MTETSEAFASLSRIIASRAHGEHELTQKLLRRGFTRPAIDAAIHHARELLLLEPDEAIARRFAQELAARASATPRSVSLRLHRRGLPPDHIRNAISEAFAEWDPDEAAWHIVEREEDWARAARRLERRGFETETIAKAVDRLRRAKPSSS